jgi:hypothetical protein
MKLQQPLALTGCGIIALSVFLPIYRIHLGTIAFFSDGVPILSTVTFYGDGNGDGIFILVLAAVSVFFILANKYWGLWITGSGILFFMAFNLINFFSWTTQAQLEFAWISMLFGVILLFIAAIMKKTQPVP